MNYKNIAKAIEFYEKLGFTYIDVPWVVSKESIDVTKPQHLKSFKLDVDCDKHLVGSAEQSFIELISNGYLPPGRYVAATPCFRDEQTIDAFHKNYFFKVELIDYCNDSANERRLQQLINCAYYTMNNLISDEIHVRHRNILQVVKTNDGYDINATTRDVRNVNVELGSYGIRSFHNIYDYKFIYGTGLAEPRFSTVINGYL